MARYMYLMDIWYILQPIIIFYGHLVHLMVVWYIFSRFGMLYREKSGNPDPIATYNSCGYRFGKTKTAETEN
jgi:hypothetical protein